MFQLIAQHRDFAVINKAAGTAVQRESDQMPSLLQAVAAALGVPRVWLVHRLDKGTSGVLLLALNSPAASELAQGFAGKTVHKTYWALSDRKPSKKQGWVKGGMNRTRGGAWKLDRGTEYFAVTRFASRAFGPADPRRLFVLWPHSGRTHQLRVAMKSLGSPILGDTLYGGGSAPRLFLHARELVFGYQGETYRFCADLDADWPDEDLLYQLAEAAVAV